MSKTKLRIGVVYGGRSGEHEVSKLSAQNVMTALRAADFSVVPIFIDKKGHWFVDSKEVVLPPSPGLGLLNKTTQKPIHIGVYFPVLHGTYGEDGTIQGLFEMAGVPYVGAGVLGSSIGMDKEVQKLLYLYHGIPTPRFEVFRLEAWDRNRNECIRRAVQAVGLPAFVKPANLGSSVGVNKAKTQSDLNKAMADAFKYDVKIVVEEFIRGREIDCAVIGNEQPRVSLPGEIVPRREFFDYRAKYVAEDTEYTFAVPLPEHLKDKVMRTALQVYRITFCEGFGRVEFLLTKNEEIFVMEINTIPGCTSHSLFPRLWEASGMPFPDVVTELVNLGMDRWEKKQTLKTNYKDGRLLDSG